MLFDKKMLCGGLAIAALCGGAVAAESIDLTAYVREKGASSLTLGFSGGNVYDVAWNSVTNAFDGFFDTNETRFMFYPTGATEGCCTITWSLADSFCPDQSFIVTGFVFHRSPNGYDSLRTPRRIRLEASATGTGDWVTLAEPMGDFNIYMPKAEDWQLPIPLTETNKLVYTVSVPRTRQQPFRHYRFVVYGFQNDMAAIHELELWGRIERPLYWNGGANGTWDATTANWTNADGTATAWLPGATAYIDADAIAVSGDVVAGGVVCAANRAPTLSGGRLILHDPSEISFGATNLAWSTALADHGSGSDSSSSCFIGVRNGSAQGGYDCLPRSDDSDTTGKAVVYWKNRLLRDVSGVAFAKVAYNYGWWDDTAISCYTNTGETATFWVWRKYKQEETRIAWNLAKVELKQVGHDITARLVKGGYLWTAIDPYGTDGSKINFETIVGDGTTVVDGRAMKIWDDTHTVDGASTGVKDILLSSSFATDVSVLSRIDGARLTDDILPGTNPSSQTGWQRIISAMPVLRIWSVFRARRFTSLRSLTRHTRISSRAKRMTRVLA